MCVLALDELEVYGRALAVSCSLEFCLVHGRGEDDIVVGEEMVLGTILVLVYYVHKVYEFCIVFIFDIEVAGYGHKACQTKYAG